MCTSQLTQKSDIIGVISTNNKVGIIKSHLTSVLSNIRKPKGSEGKNIRVTCSKCSLSGVIVFHPHVDNISIIRIYVFKSSGCTAESVCLSKSRSAYIATYLDREACIKTMRQN